MTDKIRITVNTVAIFALAFSWQNTTAKTMTQATTEILPQWYKDSTKKDLILSNDIDSLLSVKLLEQVNPEWKLKYFYDFDGGLFYTGEKKGKTTDTVGVDIALDYKDLKTFDNHVTSDNGKNINPNSINLNNVYEITSMNYSQKYCCSTVLLIYSLYNIPLPKSDLGKALLLAIDSTYYSYFNPILKKRPEWLKVHKYWLCDILGFDELYEFESRFSIDEFKKYSFINDAKIQVIDDWDDGEYTMYYPLSHKYEVEKAFDIALDVPDSEFRLMKEVKVKSAYLDGKHKSDFMKKDKVMSFAMTGKNHCSYSILK